MSPARWCGTLQRPEYSTVVALHGFGLCDRCTHQCVVRSGRGSVFSLCERSLDDPRYPKYPRVPVGSCPGIVQRPAGPPEPAGR